MRNSAENTPIELTLPADPNLMLVIRLTAAGVIARAGITVDRMDELKMAVEEACNCLMDQDQPPSRIHLRFDFLKDRLEIRATALDEASRMGNADEAELEVVRCILDALVDQTEFDVQNGWIASICMKATLAR